MHPSRLTAEGSFDLPLPGAEAIGLFTPEGERLWVPGWEPHYPAGEPSEQPGTVFTTAAHDVDTTWVVLEIDRIACRSSYARVTPGMHAGIVTVSCEDTAAGHCRVSVGYDMTALAAPEVLDTYQPEPFAKMMAEWAAMTTAAVVDD